MIFSKINIRKLLKVLFIGFLMVVGALFFNYHCISKKAFTKKTVNNQKEFLKNFEGVNAFGSRTNLSKVINKIDGENKLILKYSPLDCAPCVDSVFYLLKKEGLLFKTIILAHFDNINQMKIVQGEYEDNLNLINIPLSIDDIANAKKESPSLYLINNKFEVLRTHNPKSSEMDLLKSYLDSLKYHLK